MIEYFLHVSVRHDGDRKYSAVMASILPLGRAVLKPILPIAPNWEPRAGVIYSRLFKYTQQHTAGFTENNSFPHILRPAHPIGTLGVAALCQDNPDMMYPLLEHCINLDIYI